jgi:transposase-like protein
MSNSEKRRPGRPAKYPLEFQRDAVAMVLDESRPVADVARSTGVNEGTLRNWVAKARRERAAARLLGRPSSRTAHARSPNSTCPAPLRFAPPSR